MQIKMHQFQSFLETVTEVHEVSGNSDSKDSKSYSVLFIFPDTGTILPGEIHF